MNTHEERRENAISLWKILVSLFFLTYFLWYFNGGPEKWNEKFAGEINSRSVKQNIFNNIAIPK